MKVAYLVSRFPKLTETFVLYEMQAVEKQGISVELYPLLRERTDKTHAEAESWVKRAHFTPLISFSILRSNLLYLVRSPGTYLRTLRDLLWGTRGSLRFFQGALAFFPKSVHLAQMMHKAGIVHIHAHFASHPASAAFIIHRLTGIPYSFTAHGSDIHRDQHMLAEKTAEAAFVVPISRFNRDVILRSSNGKHADKIHVVHCGVDTSKFQPNGKNGAQSGPVQILCIGTLHEVKGQKHLIEACRILKKQGIPFSCHFIGDGPDEQALAEQTRQAGLNDQIVFHGRLDQEEVLEFLHQADLLVAPSVPSRDGRREGIPVVLMEAMACGLPVVSSRLSGIPEIVSDGVNGLLTEPGDAQAIAEAITCLSVSPALRKQFGTAGRQTIEREFDLPSSARQLARLFAGGDIQ
jgi:colanic acid/amylovoran biosynthesis glycosyltransferase